MMFGRPASGGFAAGASTGEGDVSAGAFDALPCECVARVAASAPVAMLEAPSTAMIQRSLRELRIACLISGALWRDVTRVAARSLSGRDTVITQTQFPGVKLTPLSARN